MEGGEGTSWPKLNGLMFSTPGMGVPEIQLTISFFHMRFSSHVFATKSPSVWFDIILISSFTRKIHFCLCVTSSSSPFFLLPIVRASVRVAWLLLYPSFPPLLKR